MGLQDRIDALQPRERRLLGILVGVPLTPRLRRRLTAVYPRERIQSRLVSTFVAAVKAGFSRSN